MHNLLYYKAQAGPEPVLFDNADAIKRYVLRHLMKHDGATYRRINGEVPYIAQMDYHISEFVTQLKIHIILGDGRDILNTDFNIQTLLPFYVWEQRFKVPAQMSLFKPTPVPT